MIERNGWLVMRSGVKRLYRMWWPAATAPRVIVAIVHGLGDHSGRYTPLAAKFVSTGIGVLAIDLQGQGLSPGWHGCISSYDDLLNEVSGLVQFARGGSALDQLASDHLPQSDVAIRLNDWEHDASRTVCLYGHSMGGNLALNSVIRNVAHPDRVIASAPMLRAVHPPAPVIVKLARVLMKVAPHFRLTAPVRKEWLTHIPVEKEAYVKDPLIHRRVSLRLGAALMDSGVWAIENAEHLKTPCLIVHGSEDAITDPHASQQFASRAAAAGAPLHLKIYHGRLHDLHRDDGSHEVVQDLSRFILQGHGSYGIA